MGANPVITNGVNALKDLRNPGDSQVRVMVGIRRDLGPTSDLEAYLAQMNAQWQKMDGQLNDLLQSLGALD